MLYACISRIVVASELFNARGMLLLAVAVQINTTDNSCVFVNGKVGQFLKIGNHC